MTVFTLCTSAILLARWVGSTFPFGSPLLLYGNRESGDIRVYDLRVNDSLVVFEDAVAPDGNYFWSPNRRDLLRVHLDGDFRFDLYRGWFSEPLRVGDGFDGYSTPQWSPDGRSVIVPACKQEPTGTICRRWSFYYVDLAQPQMRVLDWPELRPPPGKTGFLPRSWGWLDNETLLLWWQTTLLTLNLIDGTSETRATGLHATSRNIQWTPDFDRVMYFTTNGDFCLHVFVLAESEVQPAICGDLEVNGNAGWLPDNETVYFTMRDASGEHEIRLYDSVRRSQRNAANPPVYLDWGFDYVYPLPGTPYLVHHATFNRHRFHLIDTERGKVEAILLNFARPMRGGAFTAAPNGEVIAAINQDDRLFLLWPDVYQPRFITNDACCGITWWPANLWR